MSVPATVALTIAGFDPSSGAGVTADLSVFAAHGLYGTSAITVMTVQSTLGVAATQEIAPDFLDHTLRHLTTDLPPKGIKIGALGSGRLAYSVAGFLQQSQRQRSANEAVPVVFDPVIVSSSGHALFVPQDVALLHEVLLPSVSWITPNWCELALLTGLPVKAMGQAEIAVHHLGERHPHLHIVATGGDQQSPTELLRTPGGGLYSEPGEHLESSSTHGTGCAFSSALLAYLIQGKAAREAVASAKSYVTEAIRRAPGLGHGRGPLDLLWPLRASVGTRT